MVLRIRAGFTLIETVFAMFVFSVGALALAATTALVMRSLGESALRERAARIAAARLETLRSLGCGQAQSGTEQRGGFQTTWTVSPSSGPISAVTTISYSLYGKSRAESYSSLFACSP
jgi:prepilin-type N-terminal cleavage/methylation domain-containing protein